jgi:hypothetical protein
VHATPTERRFGGYRSRQAGSARRVAVAAAKARATATAAANHFFLTGLIASHTNFPTG